jgi:hypothetical protein
MAELVTTLICVLPIAAIFWVVLSNKKIYNAVDDILTRFFENLD